MSKPKFPRLTDQQFVAEMQPLNESFTPYGACWECNTIVTTAPEAKQRIADLKHHDAHNARHLALTVALNINPEDHV